MEEVLSTWNIPSLKKKKNYLQSIITILFQSIKSKKEVFEREIFSAYQNTYITFQNLKLKWYIDRWKMLIPSGNNRFIKYKYSI